MMDQAIRDFAKQFAWNPKIENVSKLKQHKKFIVAGMGGSSHAADLLSSWNPRLAIVVHRDYGLPAIASREHLIIASSYSGNTEETVDAFEQALKNKLPCAVITTGGKLLERAKKYNLPYAQMPNTGIQPRSALGFSFKGMLKLIGDRQRLAEVNKLAKSLQPSLCEQAGKNLAQRLKNKVPVLYSSIQNQALANIWKITLNETGKIPAFRNVFPELNHNEMNGYNPARLSKHLSRGFSFILLKDSTDHPRVQKRMIILERLYRDRGFQVDSILLSGKDWLTRTFSAVALASWTAFYTAKMYGSDPEQVPMIEEFKVKLRAL